MKMNKYLAILICAIMITMTIGYVSAFEFDNIKDYDSSTKTITIKNSFLWMFDLGDVATITLETELIEYVGSGKDVKVAEFTINNYAEDYPKFLKKMELFDTKKGDKKITRDITYKYRVLTGTREIVNSWGCGVESPKDCKPNVESYNLNEYEWVEFDKEKDLPKGEITIGVFTEVIDGDRVEWIPELFGVEIDEWAIWTSGMSLDLTHYYNMDGFISSAGIGNLQAKTGTPIFNDSNCIFGDCVNIVASHNVQTNNQLVDFNLKHRNNSLNVWVYPMGNTDGVLFSSSPDNLWGIYHYAVGGTNGIINFAWGDGTCNDFNGGGIKFPVDELHMLTITNNGSDLLFYKDGVFGGNCQQVNDNAVMHLNIGEKHDLIWTWAGAVDELATWNRTITQSEITRLYNDGTGINYTATPFYEINITLNDQINGSVISTKNATLNCSASSIGDVMNLSLIIGNVINKTVTNTSTNDTLNIEEIENFPDGLANWTCKASSLQYEEIPFKLQYFTVDAESPVLDVLKPNVTFNYLDNQTILNWTVHDSTGLDLCWYEYSGTNVTTDCGTNETILNITSDVRFLTFYANDTTGKLSSEEISWNYLVYENSQTYIKDVLEGSAQTLIVNLTYNSSYYNFIGGELFHNNTANTGTRTGIGDEAIFTSIVDMPLVTAKTNISFYWNITLNHLADTFYAISETNNQTTDTISITNCSTNIAQIFNFTIRDEETQQSLEGAGNNTLLEVEILLYPKDSTTLIYNYSESFADKNSVAFCLSKNLTNSSYDIDLTVGFESDDRVREFYYVDKGTLNSSTIINSLTSKNISLYDLITADSTSFLFNFYDEDGLIRDDVIVHTFRKYIGEGVFHEVERSKQNEGGDTIVHLVEEDVIYYFAISQEGEVIYTSSPYTALCQTTPCEILLEASSGYPEFSGDWDLVDNGGYSITSDYETREVNLSYSLTSPSTMNLTIYEINSSGDVEPIGSAESTGVGGDLVVTIPISYDNKTFFASVYKNDIFLRSMYIDMEEDAGFHFGNTLSLFLGAIIILTLVLVAVANGEGAVVFAILGVLFTGVLGIVDYRATTGSSLLIYFIVLGAIILWKTNKRRRGGD